MRIQFEFSEDAVEELDSLKDKLNLKSRGEVINQALGVLKWLVNEKANHGRIIVERAGRPAGSPERHVEIVFPQMESLVHEGNSRETIE